MRQQCLAAPSDQGEIHACRRAKAAHSVVIAGMKEITMSVEMDHPAAARAAQPKHAAQQIAAIAAENQREATRCKRGFDRIGECKTIAPDGLAIANPGAGLGLMLIIEPLDLSIVMPSQRPAQPSVEQRVGGTPGSGQLAPGTRPQTEISRRFDQVDHDAARAFCAPRDWRRSRCPCRRSR
jgi:hypothetical protein